MNKTLSALIGVVFVMGIAGSPLAASAATSDLDTVGLSLTVQPAEGASTINVGSKVRALLSMKNQTSEDVLLFNGTPCQFSYVITDSKGKKIEEKKLCEGEYATFRLKAGQTERYYLNPTKAFKEDTYRIKATVAGRGTVTASFTVPTRGTTTNAIRTTSTFDQTSVKSISNKFTLSGTANASAIFVALMDADYAGSTDWGTIYRNDDYVAYTGDAVVKVSRNKWKTSFSGISGGTYIALLYNNAGTDQSLLARETLKVTAPDSFKFTPNAKRAITLGVGQTISDGGVEIRLVSISYSNGLTGTATAKFEVKSKGFPGATYDGRVGETLGGFGDSAVRGGGVGIEIGAISVPMNTATIKIPVLSKG